MLSMQSATHSSLTTMNHRWWTKRDGRSEGWGFRTSEELGSDDKIPIAARLDQSSSKFIEDSIVDLVAWIYTHGCITESNSIQITQPRTVNQQHCHMIEVSLTEVFGGPVQNIGFHANEESLAAKCHDGEKNQYFINEVHSQKLLKYFVDGVPSFDFLNSLTLDQLDRFVQVSMLADCSPFKGSSTFVQKNEDTIGAFVYAAILSGYGVHVNSENREGSLSATLLTKEFVQPLASHERSKFESNKIVEHAGNVYCLTTEHGTWLAEREGSFYFTGNCVPLGIPHSEFLRWSEDDQDKALAWESTRREVCDLCGTKESDWIDPETHRLLDDPPLVPVGMKCHGCAEKESYRKASFKNGTPAGVSIVFMPSELVDLNGKIIRR